MTERLLTTRQAAEWLGVGPTSVKRWADDGRLACVRTAGGHRRFEAEVVRAFGRSVDGPSSEVDGLVDLFASRAPSASLQARILELKVSHGGWVGAARVLGEAVTRIGERWRAGTLSVASEHAATERLYRAVATLCDQIPVASNAPTCVLSVAAGDDHALGLLLTELCAKSVGWQAIWLGTRTQVGTIVEAMSEPSVRVVAVLASLSSEDELSLAKQARDLGELCELHRVRLVLGGEGAWPDVVSRGVRLRTFEAFTNLLDEVARRPAAQDAGPRRGVSFVNAD